MPPMMLGLTSTTLMRRIDRLEERIGCKLFLRDQSGLTLSEEGVRHDRRRHARWNATPSDLFRRASQSRTIRPEPFASR